MVSQKTTINGIKLSSELVMLNFMDDGRTSPALLRACRILGKNRINIPYITTGSSSAGTFSSCCVSAQDADRTVKFLAAGGVAAECSRMITDIGLLSIFPHRSRFSVPGLALAALALADIPIFGMASSLGTLTFALPYAALSQAAGAISGPMALPDGHTPLRPDGHSGEGRENARESMETSAVYWEPEIKIYGFQEETGLSLTEIGFPAHRLARCGDFLCGLDAPDAGFSLALLQKEGQAAFRLHLLSRTVPEKDADGKGRTLAPLIRQKASDLCIGPPNVTGPAELLHFHGPHFGDRYGVADAALRPLAEGGPAPLAAACSGAAIYLALPDKGCKKACALLDGAFKVPAPSRTPREKRLARLSQL